ncbi:PAS domain-containing protein [Nitrosomonas marina]|uniref:PAS fold n=1 Tax=Nitrosomonas marina TaxID=917 RepID=A0A1H8G1G6_9PROT|nr:PAS domain-containing protein [Nitrosomonas marina]SEN37357.1 PAS fold [Nitrosomonas marina]
MDTQSIDKAERINGLVQTKDYSSMQTITSNRPAMLMLSEDGKIFYVNKEAKKLLNFPPHQLHKLHISEVILTLRKIKLLEKNRDRVNTVLHFLSRIGYKFKLCSLNGKTFTGELFFNDIDLHDRHNIAVIIYPDSTVNSNVIYKYYEGE